MQFLIALNEGVNFLDFVKKKDKIPQMQENPINHLNNKDVEEEILKFSKVSLSKLNENHSGNSSEVEGGGHLSKEQNNKNKISHLKYRVMSFVMVGVRRDLRRCGLARKLVQHSIKVAREAGCTLVKSEAVALSSQRLYEQLNFSDVKIIQHADWKDQNGKPIFNCNDGTTCGKLMILNIQD